MFLVLLSTMVLSCENNNDGVEFKNQKIIIEKDDLTIESFEFSDLFNEGSIIKFTPNDFKKKLFRLLDRVDDCLKFNP